MLISWWSLSCNIGCVFLVRETFHARKPNKLLHYCPAFDSEILKNYRPVSNFSFVSKGIGKVIADHLIDHIAANSSIDLYQSAYRKGHSTETDVVRVHNDTVSAQLWTRSLTCLTSLQRLTLLTTSLFSPCWKIGTGFARIILDCVNQRYIEWIAALTYFVP